MVLINHGSGCGIFFEAGDSLEFGRVVVEKYGGSGDSIRYMSGIKNMVLINHGNGCGIFFLKGGNPWNLEKSCG